MRTVLCTSRCSLFSQHDLMAAIQVVQELELRTLTPQLHYAAVVQRLGNLIHATGGGFYKFHRNPSCTNQLVALYQDGWSISDAECLLYQLNDTNGHARCAKASLIATSTKDPQTDRFVHYVSSVQVLDPDEDVVLSFKRISRAFSDREAVLVRTLHHSLFRPGAHAQKSRDGDQISVRKCQVLRQLVSGRSEKEIATSLNISRHTVHVHIKWLYRHFRVNSRAELISRSFCGTDSVPSDADPRVTAIRENTDVSMTVRPEIAGGEIEKPNEIACSSAHVRR